MPEPLLTKVGDIVPGSTTFDTLPTQPLSALIPPLPTELEPCLVKICKQSDTGVRNWFEVCYYDPKVKHWKGFEGGTQFNEGEVVVTWVRCQDVSLLPTR